MQHKTLYFQPRNNFSGSCRVLATNLEDLHNGDQVAVVTIDEGGFLSQLPNVKIIPIVEPQIQGRKIPLLTAIWWRIDAFVKTLIYAIGHDTFYINTIKPYHAAIIGRLLGKRIVWHIHEKFQGTSCEQRYMEKVFNRTKAERIFVSRYAQSCYPPRVDCPSRVEYNRLSRSFLAGVHPMEGSQKSEAPVVMICSLYALKGVATFMDVACRMPETAFILVVSSPEDEIKRYFSDSNPEFRGHQVPENVTILPQQSDVRPILERTGILLCLTDPRLQVETFGMTVLEAAAYGIPAIVPEVGGPAELLYEGLAKGMTVDVTDPQAVATAINICRAELL